MGVYLWDTSTEQQYEKLRPLSYPGNEILAICFSIVDKASFDDIPKKWLPEIKHHRPDGCIVLIGLKCELRPTEKNSISTDLAKKMQKEIGAHCYVEVSATDQESIQKLLISLVLASKEHYYPTI